MNGANIGTFDINVPADTESMGLTDDRIRSVKSTFQQALNDEHNFPTAGGSAVGYHRYGSGRAYYGAQSLVSSSGTDGRIMLTSDTSKLFAVGSGGTIFLGGSQVLSVGTNADTAGGRHNWVDYFAQGITNASGVTRVTFPDSGYSGAPYVQITTLFEGSGARTNQVATIYMPTASYVTVQIVEGDDGSLCSGVSFFWQSRGTRVM